MSNYALILDLDNTIFRTRSMDPRLFDPFFDHLRASLNQRFSRTELNTIIHDLWEKTWDVVIEERGIPKNIFLRSLEVFAGLNPDLKIRPFEDYEFIKTLKGPKFLVTAGPHSFQMRKIDTLGIRHDFTKIVINDPFRESRGKKDIFEELAKEFELVPEKTLVIGDNSFSEIAAGNALGMVTIQILREGVVKGNNAMHHIFSFLELKDLAEKAGQ
jgi:FMN phosphatase YigB (HAD superfamily)